jgi:serine/threonine protein kinase
MIGKTISHYKILAKIGEGGMGVVYKEEDKIMKRVVALFLPKGLMKNPVANERFIQMRRLLQPWTIPISARYMRSMRLRCLFPGLIE